VLILIDMDIINRYLNKHTLSIANAKCSLSIEVCASWCTTGSWCNFASQPRQSLRFFKLIW